MNSYQRLEVKIALIHIHNGDLCLARKALIRALAGLKGGEFHIVMGTLKAIKAKKGEANHAHH